MTTVDVIVGEMSRLDQSRATSLHTHSSFPLEKELDHGPTIYIQASQVPLAVKNLPVNAGDARDTGSIPGWGRSPVEENSKPLQYSCLENPRARGAWWATAHGVAESDTT